MLESPIQGQPTGTITGQNRLIPTRLQNSLKILITLKLSDKIGEKYADKHGGSDVNSHLLH